MKCGVTKLSEAGGTVGKADAAEVLALLCELSQQLLAWSWEGVVGYEEMVERVGRSYGYEDATVMMEAQSATIKLDGQTTFVKGGIPGSPPMAYTQELKNMLADIYAGKLSVTEARRALKNLHDKAPPYSPFLVWLGVVIVSVGFAVDVVGTWEGMLWAGITGMATGLAFVAADRVAGFGKIVPLVATLASGIIVMLAFKFGWAAAAPGLLLISSTFVFIPGDSISTQAYELAEGKWSAGVDRLFYSIIMLVLQVTGAFLAIVLTGTAVAELFPTGPHDAFAWWAVYPGRFVFVIGILFAFHMSWKQFVPVIITLWIVTAVAQLSSMVYGEFAGTFFATIVGTILALWQARRPRSIPAFVLMIPIIFALSPGSHGLRQLETWVSGEAITGVKDLQTLVTVLLAIAMGLVVGRAIAHRWRWIAHPVGA
jgi:uncharacterized membrane protein YjjP (DUF1212 family)/uncharacterized membrane protein YjjB (DUF3815 family)